MDAVGDSSNNALAENFRSTADTERVRHTAFATLAHANQALFKYVDGLCNPQRIRKNLGWRSPDTFEAV